MHLPNPTRAHITLDKLTDYCLNADHPRGRHKARVFQATLGISAADAEQLRAALLTAAATSDAIATDSDAFGQRFLLDFQMEGPRGQVTVRSLWIVRSGEDFARLTSCFVR